MSSSENDLNSNSNKINIDDYNKWLDEIEYDIQKNQHDDMLKDIINDYNDYNNNRKKQEDEKSKNIKNKNNKNDN